jgi:MoCo/4Fe-4S cofactor protein with predicted Tat translocation signal
MSETTPNQSPNNYWMSLEQAQGNPDFAKKAESEFMSSPYANESGKDGFARREFLKYMGASVALATTACVRRPVQTIIPYAKAPIEITPGVSSFYASTWFDGIEGYGTLVRTLEGRPVKMEGNPLHPVGRGGLPARAHAEVLSLYDPDRLLGPVRNLQNKTRTNRETISGKWADIDTKIAADFAKGSVAILSSTLPSPSSRAIIADFQKAHAGTRWVQHDSLGADAVREGQRISYGKAVVPRYRLDKANLVVSIDTDFLGTYLSPVEFMKQWSTRRKPGKDMLRLVQIESMMSLTGMNADDRIRIKPSQQLDVVRGLTAIINGNKVGLKAGQETLSAALEKLAGELRANRGKSLVIAGGLATQTADAVELQVAVNHLNSLLGNDGVTVDHDVVMNTYQGSGTDLAALIADMNAGKIKTLIVHNMNPIYSLPADSGFAEALAKVTTVISTSNFNDETARYANYVLPTGSTLESWGDYELQTGVYSIQQPTIRPLHDSRSFDESLFVWTKATKGAPARVAKSEAWYNYVQDLWKTEILSKTSETRGKSFDDAWTWLLQQGVVSTSADRRDRSSGSRTTSANSAAKNVSSKSVATGGETGNYEIVLYPSIQLADGRYSNVSWMQELPDPVSKVVWDNYVSVSPATAEKEKLKLGDVVELTVGAQKLRAPVHIQPGLHDDVLAIAIGYGRTAAGKVGNDIGVNATTLASFNGGSPVYSGRAATMKKTGEFYRLVSTQTTHVIEGNVADRQLVAETTNEAWMKNPSSGIHKHKVFSIWPSHQYNKHKWGMAIDLNTCTGCSACMTACQAENNISVVGKRYVMDGREMHWIRIDRYYRGNVSSPDTVFQPMLCQQCENAPCETVCPVLATVHNDEGLNDMIYNRCVGTRYCSNNCPYKVRRFNWFNYAKNIEAPLHMALNPDVTVRTRGVMEKCTYCVHRIREATKTGTEARKGGKVVDRSIKTACEESCPTNAITFGDLNDKDSAVSKLFADARTYAVLEDLNTAPRTRYMSRVRNTDQLQYVSTALAEKEESGEVPGEGKTAEPHSKPDHPMREDMHEEMKKTPAKKVNESLNNMVRNMVGDV